MRRRRILYVTGTRAEFGLMAETLRAIRDHKQLELQLVVTGMHLSRSHGYTMDGIRKDGWTIDATVPWKGSPDAATGTAIQKLSAVYAKLDPDIVLVTGDRVEPFAAAAAARIGNRCVAHVHGGDRAQGQLDDSLRHAITKLANIHLPATRASGERIYRMGEDRFRIHVVGTPGLDGIKALATVSDCDTPAEPFVVIALHPDTPVESQQAARAMSLVRSAVAAGIERAVVIYPNNDPGWQGIARVLEKRLPTGWIAYRDLPRTTFLACLKKATCLIGNSSSGIIEAATLGTHVVNIGDRQRGRERSKNLIDVSWNPAALLRAMKQVDKKTQSKRFAGANVYGGGRAGVKIASILSDVSLDERLMNKLIRY